MSFAWLKRYVPRSLFGRTVLILLVPIITIQLVVSYVFIERLYQNVTAQMTAAMVVDLRHILDAADPAEAAARAAALDVRLDPAATAPAASLRSWADLSGRVVEDLLLAEIAEARAVDLVTDDKRVVLYAARGSATWALDFSRNRVSASNPHQLLVLMVFVSLIVTLVSFLFLKNQVRPIRQLAQAASAFGRGRSVTYRPRGATEVRQAGTAFLDMRSRIERYVEQRTLMLSGVSHDLRTPLTRLKLSLSMSDEPEAAEMRRDVEEMEAMLATFLEFARAEALEETESCDPAAILDRVVRAAGEGERIELGPVTRGKSVELRPSAVERALQNLVSNALRYGTRVRVSLQVTDKTLRYRVEDDGPGIPEDRREQALKPFARLDDARNLDLGPSVGLGLAIVSDIASQHGGALRLGYSAALGGLQADLVLAR